MLMLMHNELIRSPLQMKVLRLTCCEAAVAGGCKGHAVPIGPHRREAQQIHRLGGVLVIRVTLYLHEDAKQLITQKPAAGRT